MKKKRLWWILGISVVLLISLAVAKSNMGEESIRVTVDEVDTGDVTETVSANGRVQPEVEVKVSSDVSGEIIELNVIEGQKVEKGELFCPCNGIRRYLIHMAKITVFG